MNDDLIKQILLLGLPETGKTSFLAALYHYVSADDIADKKLTEYKLSANATYLNYIVSKWQKCEKIGRTASITGISNREVILHLKENGSNKEVDLSVPDIDGESFKRQFINRVWDTAYKNEIERTSGIILFINPAMCKAHVLIDDHAEILKLFLEDDEESPIPFDIENTPTQVVLVDLLENHFQHLNSKITPIAIIISAWDELTDLGVSPLRWVELNLPLLYQFLFTNNEKFCFKVFGISAQGGKITSEDSVKALQGINEPADRIIVQEEGDKHKNICAPIEWLISQW